MKNLLILTLSIFWLLVSSSHLVCSFVSVVHLLVGVVYCLISWTVGLPKRAVRLICCAIYFSPSHNLSSMNWPLNYSLVYMQPVNKELLGLLTPVAACHALGHVMSNVSFAAVAVSFTHTIKGIEHQDNLNQSFYYIVISFMWCTWILVQFDSSSGIT